MRLGLGLGLGAARNAVSPAALFAAGEVGAWYDPSDLTTMFQDSAGTTPVTAVGQPVGLRLDKSKGLVLGPELVTNGDFSNGTTGWTANSATLSDNAGRLQVVTTAVNQGASQSFATVSGRRYQVSVTVVSATANYNIGYGNAFGQGQVYDSGALSGARTFTASFVSNGTSTVFWLYAADAGTFIFDNISVKELPGFHASQSTPGSRAIYASVPKGGRRNLLTYSEQFDNAAWTKTNATVTANAAVAPDGTMTADKLVGSVSALANRNCCVTQGATFTVGVDHTLTFHSAPAETPHVVIYVDNSGGLQLSVAVNLSTGVATAFNYSGVSAGQTDAITVGPIVNGYRKITLVFRNQGYGSLRIASSVSQPTSTGGFWWNADGNGTSGILIWGAQLETGSTATNYQRVGSIYDITEAGVQTLYGLLYDGLDDFYVTPTITPGTDKVQVFAGVRKLSDANAAQVCELSASVSSNAGSFYLFAPPAVTPTLAFASKGTVQVTATASGFSAPITNVLTGLGDISGDLTTLRVNGTQVAQLTTDQGTGNYLAYPIYMGRRGGTTLPYNGYEFGLIVRFGATLSAAQIASTEAWLNTRTGAY